MSTREKGRNHRREDETPLLYKYLLSLVLMLGIMFQCCATCRSVYCIYLHHVVSCHTDTALDRTRETIIMSYTRLNKQYVHRRVCAHNPGVSQPFRPESLSAEIRANPQLLE